MTGLQKPCKWTNKLLEFKVDDLSSQEIVQFLEEHIADMKSISPPESKHALDLDGLKQPDITFWSAWDEVSLVGCGALKKLDKQHAEIKSMRVAKGSRGTGVAAQLLNFVLAEAKQRGFSRISLETGSMDFFIPARKLYSRFGFSPCLPFADYKKDPNSVFMTLHIKS